MPAMAGIAGTGALNSSLISVKPLFELSRQYFERAAPGDRSLQDARSSDRSGGRFPVNPALTSFAGLGLDPQIATTPTLRTSGRARAISS
jgi:hypothetical protein